MWVGREASGCRLPCEAPERLLLPLLLQLLATITATRQRL